MIAEEYLVAKIHTPIYERIATWLSDYIAELLALDVDEIDPAVSFARYGLDSSAAIGMTGDLGNWLRLDIDPAAVYDYPSIGQLAGYLAGDPQVQARLGALS
jgi:acyl carrier protein